MPKRHLCDEWWHSHRLPYERHHWCDEHAPHPILSPPGALHPPLVKSESQIVPAPKRLSETAMRTVLELLNEKRISLRTALEFLGVEGAIDE